jgi:hypothetical protein
MAVQLSQAFFALQNLGRPRLRTALPARSAVAIGAYVAQALRQTFGVWPASFAETRSCGRFSAILLIIGCGSLTANLGLKAFSPEQFTCF